MRVVRRFVIGLAGTMVCCASASAATRHPTGPWHVDYDTSQCVATRNFGTDAKPLLFVLKPSPNDSVMRMLVIQKGSAAPNQERAVLKFGGTAVPTNLLTYGDDKGRFRIIAINVLMQQFRANIAAPSIAFESLALRETFGMSDLPAVVSELDKCVVDLQEFWNIGERYKSRIAKAAEPRKPLNSLFSWGDYPWIALNQQQQGTVAMTFLVDENGGVADCSVDETSGVAVLDTMSCYIISKRAQFTPALGPDGKPIRSAHETRVSWRIAGLKPPSVAGGQRR